MAYKGQKLTRSNSVTMTFDIDTSVLTKIKRNIPSVGKRTVKYGWLNRKKHKHVKFNGQTVYIAQLAYWIEYGTRKQPPRPAFTQTRIKVRSTLINLAPKYFRASLKDHGVANDAALADIHKSIQTHFNSTIAQQKFKPLSKFTIAKKKFSFILWESGTYQHSFEVETVKIKHDKVKTT